MCPQYESNIHLILRTDLLYPLSYEGIIILLVRLAGIEPAALWTGTTRSIP